MSTYKNDLMRSLHEGVTDLFESNLVDKTTMRRFDEKCLTPTPEMSAEDVAALRTRERVSQAVLARTLGVSLNTVSQWERGERKASGAALKLLSLVKSHGLDYVR